MSEFRIIPAIDLLKGEVVRLYQGDFDKVRRYGDPFAAVERWHIPTGETLHLVDLEASREGRPKEVQTVAKLAKLGYQTQVGGGVRSIDDARLWIDAGASRVVIGTLAAENPDELRKIAAAIGPGRILPAVDVRNGMVRVSGWEETSSRSLPMVMETLEELGFEDVLVTDISRDGTLEGPSFELYRELASITGLKVIASGGVGTLHDVAALSRLPNLSGVIVGRALHDRAFSWGEADARVAAAKEIVPGLLSRIIVEDGRVVSSAEIPAARDRGDLAETAKRLEGEGADGLCIEDISTDEAGRTASCLAIGAAVKAASVPVTATGFDRGIGDIRALLEAGAERIGLGDLPLDQEDVVHAAGAEFGGDRLIGEISARPSDSLGFRVTRKGFGKEDTDRPLADWAMRLEALGVRELILSAGHVDDAYDELIRMVRTVTGVVRIPVTAAPSKPTTEQVRSLVESGGASAILVDSRIPEKFLSIPDMKRFLTVSGIPVRRSRA